MPDHLRIISTKSDFTGATVELNGKPLTFVEEISVGIKTGGMVQVRMDFIPDTLEIDTVFDREFAEVGEASA